MHTITLVLRHIAGTPFGKLFTTRDCLNYGKRGAVDQALWRLVKNGRLVRVARGVFMRAGSDQPSLYDIARIKAESFGRKFVRDCADIAYELGISEQENSSITFAISGHSSSFLAGNTKIHLKAIGQRKLQLEESPAGHAARAIWHQGKANFSEHLLKPATRTFTGWDQLEFGKLGKWLPAWLNEHLVTPRSWLPLKRPCDPITGIAIIATLRAALSREFQPRGYNLS